MRGCIVLAAGESKRFRTKKPKVLHNLLGRPMVYYPIRSFLEGIGGEVVVVVGDVEPFEKALEWLNVKFAIQNPPLGTGDAVRRGLEVMDPSVKDVFVLCGDAPLVGSDTLRGICELHTATDADVTLAVAELDDPTGYGRVVEKNGRFRIVEEADASPEEKKVKLVNSGIYVFKKEFLQEALKGLSRENAQGEFYLTDVVSMASKVSVFKVEDPCEILGVNTRWEFSRVLDIMRKRVLKRLSEEGVTFLDPGATLIEDTVKLARDVVVYPGVHIEGDTVIDEDVVIGPFTRIVSCRIERGVEIEGFSVLKESTIKEGTRIGPFSHIRPGSSIGPRAKIGNFVEVKNSTILEGTKINHLAYVGDSHIGRNVNIGAGTITCNYDGFKKYRTIIEDGAFIGSDTQLVAPVKVGRDAVVAAGSTITKDVPEGALAITRVKQKHIPNWKERSIGRKKGG